MNFVFNFFIGFLDVKWLGFFGDIEWCCWFGLVFICSSWKNDFLKDCINIFVDRNLKLYGVSLFGGENNSCWVVLEIKDVENKVVLILKMGWFLLESLYGEFG